MRLRTFTAPTIKDAMAMVREALGPDAIIISSYERPRGRGAEVRAAVEASPISAPSPHREPPAAITGLALAAGLPAPEEATEDDVAEASTKLKVMAQLARRVERKGAAAAKGGARVSRIETILAFHGLSPTLTSAIVTTLRKLDTVDATHALAAVLDTRIAFQPLNERPRRPVMVVGAPGAGKTVTVAKLAARARLAGHRIHVITTDTLRSGAVEQLNQLLARMDSRVEAVDSPAALAKALARARQTADAIFVDTPGTNALSQGERRDLQVFIRAADLEALFVLAAGGDAAEAGEQARIFADLGAARLIMTRVDAARRLGALLSASMDSGLAIAQVSLSPYLSEPLSALNAGTLARILFAHAKSAGEALESPAAENPSTAVADPPNSQRGARISPHREHKVS